MTKSDHHTDPPEDHLLALWQCKSELTPRESLIRLHSKTLRRNDNVQMAAARFLARITSSGRYARLHRWLRYIDCPQPILGNLPDFATTLAHGMADSLESEEFTEYANAMGYYYWSNIQARADLIKFVRTMWSIPPRMLRVIAPELYVHVLRNIADQTDLHTEAERNGTHYGTNYYSRRPSYPTTFLEELTSGRVRFARIDCLHKDVGILLAGPRTTTVLVSTKDQDRDKMAAHLLAHFLLKHTSRRRFQLRIEHGTSCAANNQDLSGARDKLEEEAEVMAACLVTPFAPSQDLSPICKRSVSTLLEVGVPKDLVELLFTLRRKRDIPLLALLQKPTKDVDDPTALPDPKTGSNGVVLDGDNRIYLLRRLFEISLGTGKK